MRGRSDLELARLCKVSTGTIDRWKRGVSSPHPLMQESVFRVLDEGRFVGFARRLFRKLLLAILLLAPACSRDDTILLDERPGYAQAVLANLRVGCLDGIEYLVGAGNTAFALSPHYRTATEVYRCGESKMFKREQQRQRHEVAIGATTLEGYVK